MTKRTANTSTSPHRAACSTPACGEKPKLQSRDSPFWTAQIDAQVTGHEPQVAGLAAEQLRHAARDVAV
jgi:hypothetical protein